MKTIFIEIDVDNRITAWGTIKNNDSDIQVEIDESNPFLNDYPKNYLYQNGEIIKDDTYFLNVTKENKHAEIVQAYDNDLTSPVTSSLIGTDGANIVFDYANKDQLNYSKRANTLALDTTITSFQLGSHSHGVVTMTRDDFITFMRDCDNHEMTLYDKLVNLRTQVDNATTVDAVNAITW